MKHLPPLLLLPMLGCQALLQGQYPLADENISPGRGFSMRADLFCELTCGIHYRAWDPSHELAPWSLLGFSGMEPGEIEWGLRVSPGDRWVGLVDAQYPYVVLALHDFETGFDWPSCAGQEREACAFRAGQGLLELQEPGGEPHILATQAPGDLGSRVGP